MGSSGPSLFVAFKSCDDELAAATSMAGAFRFLLPVLLRGHGGRRESGGGSVGGGAWHSRWQRLLPLKRERGLSRAKRQGRQGSAKPTESGRGGSNEGGEDSVARGNACKSESSAGWSAAVRAAVLI